MGTVGLVLGAGGHAGSAFHAAVIATLATETGWDARSAELVVGTSAGANTAVSLRAGLSPADHLARLRGEPLSPSGQTLARQVTTPLSHGTEDDGEGSRLPASPRLLISGLARRDTRPGLLYAGLAPRGRRSGASLAQRARELHPEGWPDDPTWIVAVRLDNGKRVVFGRDDVALPHIADAVQASCAVPGHYQPTVLGDVSYVDGGVHSPTNVDLVAGLGYDVVVVSSPMSAVGAAAKLVGGDPTRWWHHRLVQREGRRAAVGATKVLLIEPDAGVIAAYADGHDATVVAETARRTREALADPVNARAASRLTST